MHTHLETPHSHWQPDHRKASSMFYDMWHIMKCLSHRRTESHNRLWQGQPITTEKWRKNNHVLRCWTEEWRLHTCVINKTNRYLNVIGNLWTDTAYFHWLKIERWTQASSFGMNKTWRWKAQCRKCSQRYNSTVWYYIYIISKSVLLLNIAECIDLLITVFHT